MFHCTVIFYAVTEYLEKTTDKHTDTITDRFAQNMSKSYSFFIKIDNMNEFLFYVYY